VSLEYLDSHDPGDSGLPVIGNRLPSVPIERSLDEGGEVHTNDLRLGLRGRHTFASGWVLRHHVEARRLRAPQAPQIALAADGLDPASCSVDSCSVSRALVSVFDATGETEYGSVDLSRDFSLWRTRHILLLGMETFQSLEKSTLISRSDPSLATDLFHPQNMPIPTSLLDNPDWSSNLRTREFWAGAFIQYQVSLADRLYLLSGWRFDNVWNNVRLGVNATKTGILIPDGAQANKLRSLKQRAGILWRAPGFGWHEEPERRDERKACRRGCGRAKPGARRDHADRARGSRHTSSGWGCRFARKTVSRRVSFTAFAVWTL